MKTTPNKKTARRRIMTTTLVTVAMALAATLFVAPAADAKSTKDRRQLTTESDKKQVMKSEPDDSLPDEPTFTITPGVIHRGDHPGGYSGILCPAGTFASALDHPIYDEETGLWVIGFETVWYCLPNDLEPVG